MDTLDEIAEARAQTQARTIVVDRRPPQKRANQRRIVPICLLLAIIAETVLVSRYPFNDGTRNFIYGFCAVGILMSIYAIVNRSTMGKNKGFITGWALVILGGLSFFAARIIEDRASEEARLSLAMSESAVDLHRDAQQARNEAERIVYGALPSSGRLEVLREKQLNLESEGGRLNAEKLRAILTSGVPVLQIYGALAILIGAVKIVFWLGDGDRRNSTGVM